MSDFIMQMQPHFGEEETNALTEYMSDGGFLTEFKKTEIFENMLKDFTGAKHCIVTNSGTVSLTLAALALDLKPGDEVIVPNYTMIATPNSINMVGIIPIFVDVEPETLCLDLEKVNSAVNKRTKAIILVSANGRYPKKDILEFKKLALKKNLYLIEDAAQSLGSFYPNGKHIGTLGDIGCFSFSTPKIISTGQGGALVTNDDKLAKKIKKLKDFGRSMGGNDLHETIGFNFKFTDLQAVVGIEQMKKLPARLIRKKKIWQLYEEKLANVKQIKLFNHNLDHTSPWFIDSIVDDRERLVTYLKENQIGTRLMYPPINEQIAYKVHGSHPVSKAIGSNGLWLPSMIQISDKQIDYITNTIKSFYN